MQEYFCDIAVVGAGPAGLAAAVAAKKAGAGKVLVIERDIRTGGILQQCIHAGFGLEYFGQELTGLEYSERFQNMATQVGVEFLLDMTVMEIRDRRLICSGSAGWTNVHFGALILAMGCREKTRANLVIPGSRPAGIYTAGTAQKMINIYGYSIGKEVVILGSGDIGMIMARRLTMEGAKVKAVVEIMPFLAGLVRNKVQCLDDFDIPLLLSHTVVDISGIDRVQSVTVAPVDKERRPLMSQKYDIPCDTLLLSVGLIPENELSRTCGISLSSVTKGPQVNQFNQTEIPYVFACGNVLHVNDLVDNVSRESENAGRCAVEYISGKLPCSEEIDISPGEGVRYTCPQRIVIGGEGKVTVYFRTIAPGRNTMIRVYAGESLIMTRKRSQISPGTMEKIELDVRKLEPQVGKIIVSVASEEEFA